jgi:hypothetical protein
MPITKIYYPIAVYVDELGAIIILPGWPNFSIINGE